MNVSLYRVQDVLKSKVVTICETEQECDKLIKFGWTSTVLHCDEGPFAGRGLNFGRFMTDEIRNQLWNKRLVIFPHVHSYSEELAKMNVCALVSISLDIRIISIPAGTTVTEFLETCPSVSHASRALEKIVSSAVPFTSFEAFMVWENIRSIRKEILSCRDLWGAEKELDIFEAKVRHIQQRVTLRRQKERHVS